MVHCEVRRREHHFSGCLDQEKRILPGEDRAPGFGLRSATLSYQHAEKLALRLAGYKNCVLGKFIDQLERRTLHGRAIHAFGVTQNVPFDRESHRLSS